MSSHHDEDLLGRAYDHRLMRRLLQYLAKTVPKAERDHPAVLIASDHLPFLAELKVGFE